MPQQPTPTTETIKASEARQNWSELLNRVFKGETRLIVEKSGIPVAAVISAADFEWFRRIEARYQQRSKLLEETRAAFADVSDEEFETELARALAEVRAEQRARLHGARASG